MKVSVKRSYDAPDKDGWASAFWYRPALALAALPRQRKGEARYRAEGDRASDLRFESGSTATPRIGRRSSVAYVAS